MLFRSTGDDVIPAEVAIMFPRLSRIWMAPICPSVESSDVASSWGGWVCSCSMIWSARESAASLAECSKRAVQHEQECTAGHEQAHRDNEDRGRGGSHPHVPVSGVQTAAIHFSVTDPASGARPSVRLRISRDARRR